MASSPSRTRRFLALALAGGTLAVTSVGVGTAAAESTPGSLTEYSGSTSANVVQVLVNPTGLLGDAAADSPLPTAFELDLLSATGEVIQDPDGKLNGGKGAVAGTSTAGIAAGTLFDETPAQVRATYDSPSAANGGAIPDNPLLALGLAQQTATADRATTSVLSGASLAELQVASLADLLPAEVIAGITQLLGTVDSGTSQVTAPLFEGVQTLLDSVPGGNPATDSVKTTATNLITTLDNLVPNVTTALQNPGSLVDLDGLVSSQSVKRVDGKLVSTASSQLAGLDVLGGFVHVEAFSAGATAVAGGVPDSASATPTATTAKVTVGERLLGLELDDLKQFVAQLEAVRTNLMELQLTGPVVEQLNGLISQLSALSQLGVHVQPDQKSSDVDPAGTHAEAHASGLQIMISPPTPGGEPNQDPAKALLVVRLGAADAVADAISASSEAVQPALASTGAPLGTAAAAAAGMAIAGVVIRRRRAGV